MMVEAGRLLWNDTHSPTGIIAERRSGLHLVRPEVLDIYRGEVCQSAVSRALRAGRTGGTPQARQGGFAAFFEHQARYQRIKKFSRDGSLTYPQAYNRPVKLDASRTQF